MKQSAGLAKAESGALVSAISAYFLGFWNTSMKRSV